MSEDSGFLSRWSRCKAAVQGGQAVPAEPAAVTPAPRVQPPAAAAMPVASAELGLASPETPRADAASAAPATDGASAPAPQAPPAPTLDDVAALVPGDEISRFVIRGVDEDVKRAALKKLFTDPHYNVMDGLDIYIDDYSQPDPIPMAMLRQMNQSKFLGLFAEEDAKDAADAQAAADRIAALPPAEAPDAEIAAVGDPNTDTQDPPTPAEPAAIQASTEPALPDTPHDSLPQDADASPRTPRALAAVPQTPDEDPDLQLQPDDAAGRPGAPTGAGFGRA